MTRNNIAYVYAGLINVKDYPFDRLNKMIIKTWSFSGLKYIKEKAWKILEELHEMERTANDKNPQ